MGSPPQFDDNENEVWSGPDGVVQQLQNYAGTCGWRNKKVVRNILKACQEHGEPFDAGERVKMRKPRKRKLEHDDLNLAGKMLRGGSSAKWATTVVNHQILNQDNGRGQDDVVCRQTVTRTIKNKYDGIVHRRQKKRHGIERQGITVGQSTIGICYSIKMPTRYMCTCVCLCVSMPFMSIHMCITQM